MLWLHSTTGHRDLKFDTASFPQKLYGLCASCAEQNEILLPVYKSPRRIALSDLLDKLCHRASGALDQLLLEFRNCVKLLLIVYQII